MAKKGLVILALVVLTAGSVFAAPAFRMSAGAGGYFTSDFGGGYKASMGGYSMSMNTPYAGGGGFAFFDATFAELQLGFFGDGAKAKRETKQGGTTISQEYDFSYAGLDLGLLGKYPFAIGEKLSVFPLLGINYRFMLSAKDKDGNQYKNSDGDDAPGDFGALWFKLGGGADYSLTSALFVRGEIVYGLRLQNEFEKDSLDSMNYPGISKESLLGHGLDVKLAVGFRF